jgi:hypothetical protein
VLKQIKDAAQCAGLTHELVSGIAINERWSLRLRTYGDMHEQRKYKNSSSSEVSAHFCRTGSPDVSLLSIQGRMSDARPGLHTGLDVRSLQNMPISACGYDSALHRVA